MFFFQGLSPGFWTPALSNLFHDLGISAWVPAAFIVGPACALVSPLIGGALADQRMAADRLFAWSSLAGGIALWAAFWALEQNLHPVWFLVFFGIYGLASGPSWGLLAVVSLANMEDGPRRYPLARMGATVGWMAAGFLTSHVLAADGSVVAGYAGALTKIGVGAMAFLLPRTPPNGIARSWRSRLGLDAFALFRDADHRVFFIITLLFSVPLAAFYMYSPELLRVLGDNTPAATMAFAQVSEMIAMVSLGWAMTRWRIKTILLAALGFSVLRFAMSGWAGETGVRGWHVAGICLHGVCYTFYFVTAQMYLDRRVATEIRGQAQGLLVLVSGGLGPLVGAGFCGWLHGVLVTSSGGGWQAFWWILAGWIALCTIAWMIFYRGGKP
ncbi:MAG: MFS transporter [Verrucomicrobiota bacterium]